MAKANENIDNLILEEGFKQLKPGEWESILTGEETTSTIVDALLAASGFGGIIKGAGGLQGISLKQMLKKLGLYRGQMSGEHWRNLEKMAESVKDITKRNQDALTNIKKMRGEVISKLPKKGGPVEKYVPATKPLAKDSATKQKGDVGKWGLAGLLGILGLMQDDQGDYIEGDSPQETPVNYLNEILNDVTFSNVLERMIPDPDMSGARDMPIGQTDISPEDLAGIIQREQETSPNYYEGETSISPEDLARIIQGEEETPWAPPFTGRKRSPWVK